MYASITFEENLLEVEYGGGNVHSRDSSLDTLGL